MNKEEKKENIFKGGSGGAWGKYTCHNRHEFNLPVDPHGVRTRCYVTGCEHFLIFRCVINQDPFES